MLFGTRGSGSGGASLELRLELEQSGFGQFPARVHLVTTRVGGVEVSTQDLSGGQTTLTITPTAWATDVIGPLIVDGTPFELLGDRAGLCACGGQD